MNYLKKRSEEGLSIIWFMIIWKIKIIHMMMTIVTK